MPFMSLCAPGVGCVSSKYYLYMSKTYLPAIIIPSSFKEHPSANHYSVQSWIK